MFLEMADAVNKAIKFQQMRVKLCSLKIYYGRMCIYIYTVMPKPL